MLQSIEKTPQGERIAIVFDAGFDNDFEYFYNLQQSLINLLLISSLSGELCDKDDFTPIIYLLRYLMPTKEQFLKGYNCKSE